MANNNHFNLTLDTLAPSGSITASRYYSKNAAAADEKHLTIDKGNATYMKVWFDTISEGTKEGDGYNQAQWEAVSTTHATNFVNNGNYYYHLVLMDDVGNESNVYNTALITYDTTSPTVKNVSINEGALKTNHKDNNYLYFEFEDPEASSGITGSGVMTATITGNIENSPITVTLSENEMGTGSATRKVEFNEEAADGIQTITVTVTDAAGNISKSASDSITLDTTAAKATLILRDSKGENNLPSFVNDVSFRGVIDITLAEKETSDVVGYKIWGDIQGKTEVPEQWTSVAAKTDPITIEGLKFSLGAKDGGKDGTRTVNCKIIDDAGNETLLEPRSITLDTTAPAVTLTRDKHFISNVTGYNTVTITPSVTETSSSIASWALKVGDKEIYSGSATIPTSGWNLTSTNSLAENQDNSITLTVTDVAGNIGTSEAVLVWLDTSTPEVGITALDPWYNADFNISVTHADVGSGENKIYAWVDMNPNNTTVPSGTPKITPSVSPQTITSGSINRAGVTQSADNYMHVKVIDAVGNETTAHAKFGYDNVRPADGSIILPTYAPNCGITAKLTSSDSTSGVAFYKIWGDIDGATTEEAAKWETFEGSSMAVSVTLTGGDGNKTVNARFKDTAGNLSENSVSATVELDTQKPTGNLQLYTTKDCTTMVPSYTNVDKFYIQLQNMDDTSAITDLDLQYKVYGDFTFTQQSAQGITETAADWKSVTVDSGKTVMTIAEPAFFTSNPDSSKPTSKSVYVKFMDNSGNISDAVTQVRMYDVTPPTVAVSDFDYNRISKMRTLRRTSSGETAGKYNDEMHFTFAPDSEIQAYKVCAYMDQKAATEGTSADKAIPNTAGSINMSATGLNSNAAVNATIRGADYESALRAQAGDEEVSVDGLHIVVVYVQDLGGNWSAAAVFEA